MLRAFYQSLLDFTPSRRLLRLARASLQRVAGYTDPFFDIAKLSRSSGTQMFLDIGCHHGDTLLRFIEAGVKCPVAAFDPLPQNLAKAKSKLDSHSGITFNQVAISDIDGTARFFVNKNDQASSLLENAQGNLEAFTDATKHVAFIDVRTVTLDNWFASLINGPSSVIVKCDTQGAEGKVIRGGIRTIRENVVAFYGEVMLGSMYEGQASFAEMRQLLEYECGMVLTNIYPCLHDDLGRAVQMDALWVKPEFLRSTNWRLKSTYLQQESHS